MLNKNNPVEFSAWHKLKAHYADMKKRRIADMFDEDPDRFLKFSIRFNDMLLDFSKNIIDEQTLKHLLALEEEAG